MHSYCLHLLERVDKSQCYLPGYEESWKAGESFSQKGFRVDVTNALPSVVSIRILFFSCNKGGGKRKGYECDG